MSIHELIDQCQLDGRLQLIAPSLPSLPVARVLLATERLRADFARERAANPARQRRLGQLHADLDRYTCGDLVIVGGARDRRAYLKPLDPRGDEVWEIRSIDPRPGLRVFGRFAARDVFIATHLRKRDHLGGPGSAEWAEAIRLCKTEWRRLFPTWEPQTGTCARDYLSGDVHDLRDL